MQNPYFAPIIILLLFIILGLILFIVTLSTQRKFSTKWIALHAMAILSNLMAIVGTTGQLLLYGRTESECLALHSTAGNAYYVMQAILRVYFPFRLTLVHTMEKKCSQGIDYTILVLSILVGIVNIVTFNLFLSVMVEPFNQLCMLAPTEDAQLASFLFGTISIILDLSLNWRFITYVRSGQKNVTKTSRKSNESGGNSRLVTITMVFFLVQTAFRILMNLIFGGAFDVPFGSLTVFFALEMSINAASMIWPMIIVHHLKKLDAHRADTTATRAGGLSTTDRRTVTIQ